MDRATALDAVDLESSRFLVAASNGAVPLDTPVPTCPGWDVARLVQHLGFIHSRVAFVVSNQRTKAPDPGELSPAPDGAALIPWFAEQRTAMLAALTAADGDALVWNWTADSPGPVSFWCRRMAHETLIHRVDIELAHGSEPAEGDPEVSADTVAEFFEIFFPGSRHSSSRPDSAAPSTFTPRTSPVRSGRSTRAPGAVAVTREHAKADAALRGEAFDLACWIWGRLPAERVETFGDRQIPERFQEVIRA